MNSRVAVLPKLKRGKLSEHVVMHLAREIAGGRLQTGQPLPAEAAVAVQLGVSKAVVRESFQALAALGMALIQQGKRTIVLDRNEWNILAPIVQEALYTEGRAAELTRQLYEVRLVLESNAAALASQRADQSDRAALMNLVDGMRAITAGSGRIEDFLQIDRAFHEKIARATRNIVLPVVLRSLSSSLFGGWTRSQITAADLHILTEQHAQVAAAIGAGDSASASRAMETHLAWARRTEADRAELHSASPARAPE